ncbi:hypothetical protein [Natrarchaeobaculum aegyptiacum]|uniref:Uncharacterized protein n=1 Tax=Natrarchaeobaculum aegyptiacum TaxID=745377 RepID=A0A2Z2HS03_9EURY|nr:hypothetical protein [Natrarchaeobaculum aegyptiacum]ARS89573.1 hypothetical protein B1756_07340 [Natrarchaeobaculum aegyptiacum]
MTKDETREEANSDVGATDDRERSSDWDVDRRRLLGLAGSAGTVALAGCTIDEDGIRISFGDDPADPDSGDGAGSTDPDSGDGAGSTDPDSGDGAGSTDPDSGDGDGADDGGAGGESGDGADDEEGDGEDDGADKEAGDSADDEEEEKGSEDGADDEEDASDDSDADGEDDGDPEPTFSEDCINVDPTNLSIDSISGGRWRIRSGRSALLIFDEKENAERAKTIIEHYGFTSYCFVGRPDPPMTYWLVDGSAPSASDSPGFSEDCINVDPTNLSIDSISGGRWRIRSGSSALLIFDEKENAETAKAIIEHYGFTSYCFVGRPDPPMTYWRR